jgi:hypothetical protein
MISRGIASATKAQVRKELDYRKFQCTVGTTPISAKSFRGPVSIHPNVTCMVKDNTGLSKVTPQAAPLRVFVRLKIDPGSVVIRDSSAMNSPSFVLVYLYATMTKTH